LLEKQKENTEMPLTNKGKKIMRSMTDQYGSKKGKKVFYASKNKGTIMGVEDETQMNWQDRIYGSLTETRASKKTQKAKKKATCKKKKEAPMDTHKAGEHKGEHHRDSFHAISDPRNDQYLQDKGTARE